MENQQNITISDYLIREIGGNINKRKQIPQLIELIKQNTQNETLDLVRGDGNCLIRAIIRYMRKHTPQIFVNIVINLFELSGRNIIIPEIGNNIDRKVHDNYDDIVCVVIRELIEKRWDYKGSAMYHMDDNAIDGDAVRMVLRLMCVNDLNIFQAFDGADRKQGWRNIKLNSSEKLFHDHTNGISVALFTLNGCHYSAIV